MYNTMRITGLASGIDTDEMIQNLMKVERIKVDRVEQDRQTLLWRQEIYNDLNKDFANFILNTRKMFDITTVSRTGAFLPKSYESISWTKKISSSNESIATVSSAGKALDGNYNVEVKQLAEGASLASGVDIRKKASTGEDGKIYDEKVVVGEDGKIYDQEGNAIKNLTFTINDGNKDFKIEVYNSKGISMYDVVEKINTAKITVGEEKDKKEEKIQIRASYEDKVGRFFLQTTRTGKEAQIKITAEGTAADFINGLNLTTGEKIEIDGKEGYRIYNLDEEIKGQDAIINFNGAQNIEYSTNDITINGITMNIVSKGKYTINVSTDVDGVYEKIEEFVNKYNELVDRTNKLLGEKVYRDFRPLTSEQKKAMEKSDIELWEEKAKSGLLKNDDIIQRTMLSIRQNLYKQVDEFNGSFNFITEIGISTEKYSRGNAGGKLVIDEHKLKEAIAKDPEGLIEFLFKESVPQKKDKSGNIIQEGKMGGIVTRVYDNLMVGMEEIIKKSGTGENADLYRGVKSNILIDFVTEYGSISTLDEDVLKFSRRIDDLNQLLYRKENDYYAKFAAMEKAISRMNQQNMWLMQQFSG